MSQHGNGYNNPAFCNQFDTSLYDYEYVPEIDPDSPNFERSRSFRPSKQVLPWSCEQRPSSPAQRSNSDEFENSDESNKSIVIEECNNRRVTLICEKRGPIREEDGGYAHDISLESNPDDEDNQRGFVPVQAQNCLRNSRRDRSNTMQVANYHPCEKTARISRQNSVNRHRYEDLDSEKIRNDFPIRSAHRYAEIDNEFEAEGIHFLQRKPRAPSPPSNCQRYSSNPSSQSSAFNIRRTPSPDNYNYKLQGSPYNEPFPDHPHTSSPIQSPNVFELSDFSPPRHFEHQREPPIGASANQVTEPSFKPRTSQKAYSKPFKNFEEPNCHSPSKQRIEKRNLLTPKSSPKVVSRKDESMKKPMVRRNISSSFYNESTSPYRPTTQSINNRNTAVITPILQRKFSDLTNDKMSRLFQSTGNVLKCDNSKVYPRSNLDYAEDRVERMTRNRSVPNFQQHMPSQKRTPVKLRSDIRVPITPIYDTGLQPSPAKSPERFSPMNKSRASLLENFKASWSNLGSETSMPSPGCLTLAAMVQLASGMASCAICFYLLSLLGRRYYLDLGMLSGFVSLVLGALGFRSHRWRWLPHRNYVTGYYVLSSFSLVTAGCLIFIITVRPMSGDPMLDVTAGAICAISVIIIMVALTGLTLSGCCKAPPPDNRVTCA